MNPWETVIEHHFIDRYFENARVAPGRWFFSDPPPPISSIANLNTLEFAAQFGGNHWAQFQLNQAIPEIIGIECDANIYFPAAKLATHGRNVLSIDNQIGLSHTQTGLIVGIGNNVLTPMPLAEMKWNRIRWVWHITGRFEIYIDNSLVLYRNNILNGTVLNIRKISMGGIPNVPGFGLVGNIRHFHLKVLTLDHSLSEVAKYLPPLDPKELEALKECREPLYNKNKQLRLLIYKLMSQFILRESKNWQTPSREKSPFNDRANKAHLGAPKLGEALVQNIKGERNGKIIMSLAKIFFEQLNSSVPREFKQLLNDIESLNKRFRNSACGRVEDEIMKKYNRKFPKLGIMSDKILEIANKISQERDR